MKNTILIIATFFISLASFAQTKISEMPTFAGNGENAFVPIIIGSVNYKTMGKNLAAGKIDSLKISGDTLYSYKGNIRSVVGIITGGTDSAKVVEIIAGLPGIPAENIGPYDTAMVNTGNGGFGIKTFKNFGLPEANAIVAYRGAANGIQFADADGRSSTDPSWMKTSSSQKLLSFGNGSIIDLYTSESQISNYQKLRIQGFPDSTIAFHNLQNGTSSRLPFTFLGAQGSIFRIGYANTDSAFFLMKAATNSGSPRPGVMIDYDVTNTNGTLSLLDFAESRITGTATAGFVGLRIAPQRVSLGSGSNWLLRVGWANHTYPTQPILDTLMGGFTARGEIFVRDTATLQNMANLTGIWGDSSGFRKLIPFSRFEGGTGMTNPMTTAGDIIVGGASGTPTRLGKGTDGQVLKMVSGNVAWGTDNTGGAGGEPSDGDKGDISVNSGIWTIDNGVVTNAKQATMPTKTYKGNTTGSTAAPTDVPVATLKSDLNLVKGDVGLGNVDNTSDATKNSAAATLTNKTISGSNNTLSNISQASITALLDTLTAMRNRIEALQANVTVSYAIWQDEDSLRFDFGGTDTALYMPQARHGIYNPTFSNLSDVATISIDSVGWLRVGNSVQVWGGGFLNSVAASGDNSFEMTLPFSVSFPASLNHLGGGGTIVLADGVPALYISPVQGTNRVKIGFTSPGISPGVISFNFGFRIY